MIDTEHKEDLTLTLGIEEEFFLVDPKSRDLLSDPDIAIFKACEDASGEHKVVRELLRTQVETNTKVCQSVAELRQALRETRKIVIETADAYGAAAMASSTHPFALWQEQAPTPKERYERFTVSFQDIVRRFLVGGMHIHLGFGNEDSRIRIMSALRRYLPLLHALSTSSPFNEGRETGFKSWRLVIVGGLPRTGIPRPLKSWAEYEQILREYHSMNFIQNGSELWWDIRPSISYPTVEMRICDICTDIEDAMCIAAIYASLVRMLMRKDQAGKLPEEPLTEVILENRWVAQRYGTFAFFGDSSQESGRIDIDDYVRNIVADIAEDARALGCEEETQRAIRIIREGTSSDRQLDLYRWRRHKGDSVKKALREVVDSVLEETRAGILG